MTIIRNGVLDTPNFGSNALRFAYGDAVLAPDAGGGFVNIAGLQFSDGATVFCNYGPGLFTGANSGNLLAFYTFATRTLSILSTNIADDNPVVWLIVD